MLFTPDDIQSRLRDRPFTPVRFVTTSGQTYDIYHPDLVMVGSNFLIVGTPNSQNPRFFESVTRVALAHVAELRDLPAPIAPASSA